MPYPEPIRRISFGTLIVEQNILKVILIPSLFLNCSLLRFEYRTPWPTVMTYDNHLTAAVYCYTPFDVTLTSEKTITVYIPIDLQG